MLFDVKRLVSSALAKNLMSEDLFKCPEIKTVVWLAIFLDPIFNETAEFQKTNSKLIFNNQGLSVCIALIITNTKGLVFKFL